MRSRARGFTLIEMIVATIVLVVGGVAAMMAISSSIRSIGIAESYSKAALLAEQRIAELETEPDSLTTGDQQGDFGTEYPGYQWSQSVEPTDLADAYSVTLVVTWNMGSRQGRARFVTTVRTSTS